MVRLLRLEFSGALYYVTSRGDGREAIFHADGGRWFFLDVLEKPGIDHGVLLSIPCGSDGAHASRLAPEQLSDHER